MAEILTIRLSCKIKHPNLLKALVLLRLGLGWFVDRIIENYCLDIRVGGKKLPMGWRIIKGGK